MRQVTESEELKEAKSRKPTRGKSRGFLLMEEGDGHVQGSPKDEV